MKPLEKILYKLKTNGEKITIIRRLLVAIFLKHAAPISVPELIVALQKKHQNVNKTTVYRQLEVLMRHELIREVLTGRATRYELVQENNHHHHLVCIKCDKITDICLTENNSQQEKDIFKQKKFIVLQHSIEFFGTCKNCQKK